MRARNYGNIQNPTLSKTKRSKRNVKNNFETFSNRKSWHHLIWTFVACVCMCVYLPWFIKLHFWHLTKISEHINWIRNNFHINKFSFFPLYFKQLKTKQINFDYSHFDSGWTRKLRLAHQLLNKLFPTTHNTPHKQQ